MSNKELPGIYESRATYSVARLESLRSSIARMPEAQIQGLTIFCAGSYGRREASKHSDIDLFFLCVGDRRGSEDPRTAELRLFGKLIEVADKLGFPKFSNDCQYLKIHSADDVLEHLGSPRDDYENYFTLRLLMLLESQCLFGEESYSATLSKVINAYYRDYPDHKKTFEPTFLLNDIGRFWKTLLLNYENRRNESGRSDLEKTKQKVRNFKLKFSRMTTCFATIAAIASQDTPVEQRHLLDIVSLTPRQRLERAAEARPSVSTQVRAVLDEYAWFLELTALSTEGLREHFQDRTRTAQMFERAQGYRDIMFHLLDELDRADDRSRRGLLRSLVI